MIIHPYEKPVAASAASITAQNPEPVHETVLLIHGTFANHRAEDHVDWWHPTSSFCTELDALLTKEGAPARCWAHLAQPSGRHRDPFAWTGANSERARHDAGRALAEELVRLEVDPDVKRYHLIGHSHGGNVILTALRAMPRAPTKLGGCVFLGTPVLSFRHREALDVRWVAIPLYILLLTGCIWGVQQWPDSQPAFVIAAVAVLIALIAELVRSNRRAWRTGAKLYGSGRASAFVFDGDEAITSLISAQGIARDAKRFIEQFISQAPLPPFAFTPTTVPEQGFDNQIQNTGAYAVLQALQGSTAYEYLPQTPRVKVQPIARRPPISEQLQWLGKVIDAGASGTPFKSFLIAALWVCAALPLLVLLTASTIHTFVTKSAGVVVGATVLSGGKLLGRWALPVLVRKAAMGADFGRFVEVGQLPPGVDTAEKISDVLRDEVALVSTRLGQDAGQAMLRAVAQMDAFAIKAQVTNALTNSALAHSHYYKADEVKERIAQIIASPSQQVSSPTIPVGPDPGFAAWMKGALSADATPSVFETAKKPPAGK